MPRTVKKFEYNHRVLGVAILVLGLIIFLASLFLFSEFTNGIVGKGVSDYLSGLSTILAYSGLFAFSLLVIFSGARIYKKSEVIDVKAGYLMGFCTLMLALTILFSAFTFAYELISPPSGVVYDVALYSAMIVSFLFFGIITLYLFTIVSKKYGLNLKNISIFGAIVLLALMVFIYSMPKNAFNPYGYSQVQSVQFTNNPIFEFLNGTPVKGAEVDAYVDRYNNGSLTRIGTYYTDSNGWIDVSNLSRALESEISNSGVNDMVGLVVYAKTDNYEGYGYLDYSYHYAGNGGGGGGINIIYLINNESYYPHDSYGLMPGIYIVNNTVLYYGSLSYNDFLVCFNQQQQECIQATNCSSGQCNVSVIR